MYSCGTSVLFVCRICKASFQIVDDFIEHKKEEHSVEFRTSNCIVFEDILILNTSNDEEKNCGLLSTVKEKGNPVPSLNVPVVGIENNFAEVDLSHSPRHISHDPADALDPFPISTSDYENEDNHENFSYEDGDETSGNALQPNRDSNEAYDLPRASADFSFNFIESKTELAEFEMDQKIHTTALDAMTHGPQNPYVLLKKLGSKEIQKYSRLQNQDTVQAAAAAEVDLESRCKLCLEKFNSEAELEIHCSVCILDNNKRDFKSDGARNIHNIKFQGTEDQERELCRLKSIVCQKMYMKKDSLTNLMESHKGTNAQNKPFKCDQCSVSFFRKYNLSRHQSIHALTRPVQCPEPDCGKAFKIKEHLQKHLSCVHCNSGESFKCQELINRNEFHGTEEGQRNLRKFKCGLCQKVYMEKESLTYHIKSHKDKNSRTRPFHCDQCSSSFIAKYHLKRHEAGHAIAQPLQCPEPGCEKAFKREEYLKNHLQFLHSNILELFKCPEQNCTSSFKRKEHLRRHSRRCHTTKPIP